MVNEQGEIKSIKAAEVSKRFDIRELRTKASAIDSQRNTIYPDNVVRIVSGKNKGRKGVIKYINKNTVFLWDRDFQQTNGIFVEST